MIISLWNTVVIRVSISCLGSGALGPMKRPTNPLELLNVYTDVSKLILRCGQLSLLWEIGLQHISPTAGLLQRVLAGGVDHVPCRAIDALIQSSFHPHLFSDSQTALKSLSYVANNFRIVREYRCCLNHLSGRFSVKLI